MRASPLLGVLGALALSFAFLTFLYATLPAATPHDPDDSVSRRFEAVLPSASFFHGIVPNIYLFPRNDSPVHGWLFHLMPHASERVGGCLMQEANYFRAPFFEMSSRELLDAYNGLAEGVREQMRILFGAVVANSPLDLLPGRSYASVSIFFEPLRWMRALHTASQLSGVGTAFLSDYIMTLPPNPMSEYLLPSEWIHPSFVIHLTDDMIRLYLQRRFTVIGLAAKPLRTARLFTRLFAFGVTRREAIIEMMKRYSISEVLAELGTKERGLAEQRHALDMRVYRIAEQLFDEFSQQWRIHEGCPGCPPLFGALRLDVVIRAPRPPVSPPPRTAPAPPARWIFMHVPKCGGSSLEVLLKSNAQAHNLTAFHHYQGHSLLELSPAKRQQVQLWMGHFKRENFTFFNELLPAQLFTVLREPHSLYISLFHYTQNSPFHPEYAHFQNKTLRQVLTEGWHPSTFKVYLGGDNATQTLNNLRREYIAVGIMERMPETLRLLQCRLPWLTSVRNVRENVSPTPHPPEDDETMQLLRAYAQEDSEIYESAMDLFDEQLALCGECCARAAV